MLSRYYPLMAKVRKRPLPTLPRSVPLTLSNLSSKFIEHIVVALDQSRDNDLRGGALEICWPAQQWKNNRLIN